MHTIQCFICAHHHDFYQEIYILWKTLHLRWSFVSFLEFLEFNKWEYNIRASGSEDILQWWSIYNLHVCLKCVVNLSNGMYKLTYSTHECCHQFNGPKLTPTLHMKYTFYTQYNTLCDQFLTHPTRGLLKLSIRLLILETSDDLSKWLISKTSVSTQLNMRLRTPLHRGH